ncbi:MAG: Dyp-type peroxidase [Cyanobium sp.]|jgi:deferrochelatase/peroxidase EfeB
MSETSSLINFADIQANVVRGYSARLARHLAIAVPDTARGCRLLQQLLPNPDAAWPTITPADAWQRAGDQKPHDCLTIGITSAGLQALGVPDTVLALFPERFRLGPAAPADLVRQLGDDGPSDPSQWILGAPQGPTVHLLLSLYVHSSNPSVLDERAHRLEALLNEQGAVILSRHDAAALPEGRVHFGFRDSISQPLIKGVPRKNPLPDMQPECEPGDFLLGNNFKNQYDGNFLGDIPAELGTNGSYGAFRILMQDVAGFEALLERTQQRYNIDKEMVAAKLMGRWRNGVPLTLSPETGHTHLEHGQINQFDYSPTPEYPTYFDDSKGLRCPIGSHIRRMNPRGGRVMGQPHSRRIIRRAMPYGSEYHHGTDDPTLERGLIGYFICGDLEMQYEFLISTWANLDFSQAGLRGTRDPIFGAQPEENGKFVIRINDTRDPIVLTDLPRWVITRGSVYCFLPGISALRHLALLAP